MGTQSRATVQGSQRLAADRTWVRWGVAAAVAGMLAWVIGVGWLSAAAHLLVLFTLAQRGAFAPDGIIAALVPLTTVIWILALAATLPRSWRTAAGASFEAAG